MMGKMIAAAAAALLIAAGVAHAADDAPLTEDIAMRFVETLEPTMALGDELEASGGGEALKIKNNPKKGEPFKPYSSAVDAMKKELPNAHKKLDKIVNAQGFTAESWGNAGDRVIAAYIAHKMDVESPGAIAQMRAMDPSLLAQMPPNIRAQFESSLAMVEAIENVSDADKKAILPSLAALEAFMDKE